MYIYIHIHSGSVFTGGRLVDIGFCLSCLMRSNALLQSEIHEYTSEALLLSIRSQTPGG